jgi:hypothetical protein
MFLTRADVRPLPSWGVCRLAACLRAAYGSRGLCQPHAQRWNTAATESVDIEFDFDYWCRTEDGITASGVANLRGLDRLVVVELLGGLQLRTGTGSKTRPSQLNRLARAARRQQVTSLRDVDPPARARSQDAVRVGRACVRGWKSIAPRSSDRRDLAGWTTLS